MKYNVCLHKLTLYALFSFALCLSSLTLSQKVLSHAGVLWRSGKDLRRSAGWSSVYLSSSMLAHSNNNMLSLTFSPVQHNENSVALTAVLSHGSSHALAAAHGVLSGRMVSFSQWPLNCSSHMILFSSHKAHIS